MIYNFLSILKSRLYSYLRLKIKLYLDLTKIFIFNILICAISFVLNENIILYKNLKFNKFF